MGRLKGGSVNLHNAIKLIDDSKEIRFYQKKIIYCYDKNKKTYFYLDLARYQCNQVVDVKFGKPKSIDSVEWKSTGIIHFDSHISF